MKTQYSQDLTFQWNNQNYKPVPKESTGERKRCRTLLAAERGGDTEHHVRFLQLIITLQQMKNEKLVGLFVHVASIVVSHFFIIPS